jgi:hypothetical protein
MYTEKRPMRRTSKIATVALCAALIGSCAPKQRIPVDCVPRDVEFYVDGERLEETPEMLVLRADRDHVVFLKGEGYRPEMVVLRAGGGDEPRLEPAELCVRPVLLRMERDIQVEIQPD